MFFLVISHPEAKVPFRLVFASFHRKNETKISNVFASNLFSFTLVLLPVFLCCSLHSVQLALPSKLSVSLQKKQQLSKIYCLIVDLACLVDTALHG
jgi:hypothetical protein